MQYDLIHKYIVIYTKILKLKTHTPNRIYISPNMTTSEHVVVQNSHFAQICFCFTHISFFIRNNRISFSKWKIIAAYSSN